LLEQKNFEVETWVPFTSIKPTTINALAPQGETDWALPIILN